MPHPHLTHCGCGRTRRTFLADTGMGFTGLALGALLAGERVGQAAGAEAAHGAASGPHFPPKAKSVIWIFMIGGVSHMESFDPKPALNKYAGKSIDETPFKDALEPSKTLKNLVNFNPIVGNRRELMGLNTGLKKYGQCGLEVGDWFANIGSCADDLAVVRSLWTIDNDHGSQLTWHTGRHAREGAQPTIGSWAAYGLGTLNENLPEFVVLGEPPGRSISDLMQGAAYLGNEHGGVRLEVGGKEALQYMLPGGEGVVREELLGELGLLGQLNHLAGIDYPDDPRLRARIKSYELAFRMQTAVPETLGFENETAETKNLYGLDQETTRPFGQLLLAARRLVERGVRFVQVYHGHDGAAGHWDSHNNIKKNHTEQAAKVDLPTAGLIKDLKRRGLLDETLVVWGTEFGRTPAQPSTATPAGRDHHPQAFCAFLAGGGIKPGVVHGATDELGCFPTDDGHYVTDIHATVLHQLGLDPLRLEVPGRKRIDMDRGKAIKEIIA